MMNRFFTLLLAASCLTAVGQVPDYVPTDGLVAWYPLSENGNDASGNGNHLVQIGSPDWLVDGVRAYCELDGEGTHFYHPEASFPEVEELTISFWTRLDVFSSGSSVGSIRPMVSKHYSSPAGSFILHARTDGIRGTYAEPHTLELDTWYHVTCVFSDVIKLYIDGQIVNEAESPTNGWNATDYPFMVGGWLNQPWWSNAWSNSALSFDGGLSSIGLWSRVLDDEEIFLLTNPEQGCMHDQACNFNESAVVDNNSCDFVSCHCLTGTVWSEELGGCIGDGSGDINLDGCVQLNDLLDLLSAYGDCGAEESAWQCGDPLDYQGYNYETVQIGEQCWFAENLRYLPEVAPVELGSEDDGLPHSYVYGYEGYSPATAALTSNYSTFGALYNHHAVESWMLCPSGWHVPSDDEFVDLSNSLGGFLVAGGKMKSSGELEEGSGYWIAPNSGASNSSGFNALPAGERFSTGGGDNVGWTGLNEQTRFWTSSVPDNAPDDEGLFRSLWYASEALSQQNGYPKSVGMSIRCIKDSE